jgi:hypothetical protein
VEGKDKKKDPKVKDKKKNVDSSKNTAQEKSHGELHPSWEAKKLAKEQAAAKMANVKPTKIVFDDDD